jgi:hypothetical protein
MELEVLLEPGLVDGGRPLDVDPAQAVVLDDLDVGLSELWLMRFGPADARTAPEPWLRKVRHRI